MFPATTPQPLAPLMSAVPDEPRKAISRAAECGFRAVQFSATQRGLRPRELDQSARRDLLAVLRRHETALAGIDLWIPSEHFTDEAHVSRAVDATIAGIILAGDLGRVPLSMNLPTSEELSTDAVAEVLETLSHAAQQYGVRIADHAVGSCNAADGAVGIGIDPAAYLSTGHDPSDAVHGHADRLVAARICDINAAGMRCAIGERDGRLDVTAYGIALSVAGYQRPIVIDARQWANPWSGIIRTAGCWAQYVATP